MDEWARLLGTLVLVLLPGLAGWAWAWHAHRYGSGRTVIHESASLVVCDEKRPSGGALRMLLFKANPTLRQSEVTIGAGGEVEFGAKTPLHSHVNRAMALGLAMLPLERRRLLFGQTRREAPSDYLAIAVVGAGACILPSWLTSLSSRCRVVAVECSGEVIEAARRCFGLNDAPPAQLQVVVEDGVSFVKRCEQGSHDALLVTAGGMAGLDESSIGEQFAPPASMSCQDFAADVLRALRPGGLYGVNVLCRTEHGSAELVKTIRETVVDAGFTAVHVATSGSRPQRNFLLFAAAPAVGDAAVGQVSSAELAARYAEVLGSSTANTSDRTLPIDVRWQCFEEWERDAGGGQKSSVS